MKKHFTTKAFKTHHNLMCFQVNFKTFILVLLFVFTGVLNGFAQTTFIDNSPGGTETFTVPAGVTSITVSIWGGGGGGGGSESSNEGGGGGGGGGAATTTYAVTPGQTFNYVVGNRGAGGSSSPTNGAAGTATTFAAMTANGGAGGIADNGSRAGGAGGTASGGTTNVTGANGVQGDNGNNGRGGAGGNSGTVLGVFGAGGADVNADYGNPGTIPGGGGGGGNSSTWFSYPGGNGAYGQVRITYTELTPGSPACPTVVAGGVGLSGADPAPFACTAPSTCTSIEANYIPLGNTSTYTVSSIGYTPPVAYSGGYNQIIVGEDDVWSGVINLPFNFCFYGNNYSQCVVGANGMISFNTALANAASGYLLTANMPSTADSLEGNTICGVGQDIDPSVGGQIGWKLVNFATGCRALVVSYYQVPMYASAQNGETPVKYFTGMMVLYENTNIIDVYIEHKVLDSNGSEGPWNDLNAVVGVQNAGATAAVVAPGRNVLDANWTATNEAWRFTPAGPTITSLVWHEGSGVSGPNLGSANPLTVCPTGTTTYTAEITYSLCDGSTMVQTEETTVTVQQKKVWDGSVDTDWAKADNWTPSGVPTNMDCVVIPDVTTDPIVAPAGTNGVGLNLTVHNGGALTTNTGTSLTITDFVNVNAGGTYNLKNSSSLIQINNVANTGNINLERIANLRLQDYSYWSSPVGNGTLGTFPVQNVSPLTPAGYIFKWGTTNANPNGGEGNWVNTSENMIPTKGYILRAPNGFSNSVASALTSNFIGVPNNGGFTTTIYRGNDHVGLGLQGILRTVTDDNWNLIGNPYPSALGVNEFLTDLANINITGGIKIWTHGQLPTNATDPFYQDFVSNYYPSDYITVNLTGATSGSGDYKIGSGQGFMVLMVDGVLGSSTVSFTNSMRSATFANSQFYRTAATNSKNRIWLDFVSPSNQTTRTLVGYIENATSEKDRLFDTATDYKPAQNFYSVLNEEPMEIQGKSLPFDEYDTIDLGFKAATNGIYTIAMAESDGLFEDKKQNVYLEDKYLHIIHDLNNAVYTFTTNEGIFNDRFLLRYTLSEKSDVEVPNEVKVFVNKAKF